MSHNVLLATWTDSAKAYESFSKLEESTFSGINRYLVIERQSDGKIKINDSDDNNAGTNTFGGSLIGSLVGILGGPLGVLLGFSSGALLGSLLDVNQDDKDQAVLSEISKALPVGTTGLLVDIDEDDENNEYGKK